MKSSFDILRFLISSRLRQPNTSSSSCIQSQQNTVLLAKHHICNIIAETASLEKATLNWLMSSNKKCIGNVMKHHSSTTGFSITTIWAATLYPSPPFTSSRSFEDIIESFLDEFQLWTSYPEPKIPALSDFIGLWLRQATSADYVLTTASIWLAVVTTLEDMLQVNCKVCLL